MLARRIFIGATIWGVAAVTPLFFMEGWYAARYGGGQPVWYYGFACVTLAWQFAYLLCGLDPIRFRPLMPLAMAAKLSFGVASLILWQIGRTPFGLWVITTPDLVLVVLFFWAWMKTPRTWPPAA